MIVKKNVKIDVREVSWSNGKVNKYQAVGIVTKKEMNGDTVILKRIYGDPQESKLAAIVSLKTEAIAWEDSAAMVYDKINEGMSEKDDKE